MLPALRAELGDRLDVTADRPGADAGDADLVIVDGDALSAERIRFDPELADAVAAGRWVLALDLSRRDRTGGLGGYTAGATAGGLDTDAVLFRWAYTDRGVPRLRKIDFVAPPEGQEDEVASSPEDIAERVAQELRVPDEGPPREEAGRREHAAASVVRADMSKGLLTFEYADTIVPPQPRIQVRGNDAVMGFLETWGDLPSRTQEPSVTINVTAQVFLANGGRPRPAAGKPVEATQWVIGKVEVLWSPGQQRGNYDAYTQVFNTYRMHSGYGAWTGNLDLTVAAPDLVRTAVTPDTVNASKEVRLSQEQKFSFNGKCTATASGKLPGGGASKPAKPILLDDEKGGPGVEAGCEVGLSYESSAGISTTYQISDWNMQNRGGPVDGGRWRWYAESPCDLRLLQPSEDFGTGTFFWPQEGCFKNVRGPNVFTPRSGDGMPEPPNQLSTGQLRAAVGLIWRSKGETVRTTPATITTKGLVTLYQNFCNSWNVECAAGYVTGGQGGGRQMTGYRWNLGLGDGKVEVPVNAVVPVGLRGPLFFRRSDPYFSGKADKPTPVTGEVEAGTELVGQVVLRAPAPMPMEIPITAAGPKDSTNLSIDDASTFIRKGETGADCLATLKKDGDFGGGCFRIQTTRDGIAAGETSTWLVGAHYGWPSTEKVTLVRPAR